MTWPCPRCGTPNEQARDNQGYPKVTNKGEAMYRCCGWSYVHGVKQQVQEIRAVAKRIKKRPK